MVTGPAITNSSKSSLIWQMLLLVLQTETVQGELTPPLVLMYVLLIETVLPHPARNKCSDQELLRQDWTWRSFSANTTSPYSKPNHADREQQDAGMSINIKKIVEFILLNYMFHLRVNPFLFEL